MRDCMLQGVIKCSSSHRTCSGALEALRLEQWLCSVLARKTIPAQLCLEVCAACLTCWCMTVSSTVRE